MYSFGVTEWAAKRIYDCDKYLQCGPGKIEIKCKVYYNDNKQMGEHSSHMQCKVITFVMVIQKFVITIMTDNDYNGKWQIAANLVERWS